MTKKQTGKSDDLVPGRIVHFVTETGCLPAIVTAGYEPEADKGRGADFYVFAKPKPYFEDAREYDGDGAVGSWHWPQECGVIEAKQESKPKAKDGE